MAEPLKTDTILNHLAELRQTLLWALVFVLMGFALSAFWAKDLYHLLTLPLVRVLPKGSHFIATHPFEAWITYLKTAFFAGLFLSLPMIFWQFWHFVSPGLYKKEKKVGVLFVVLASVFFVGGALFGYFVVFPFTFDFFIGILQGTDIVFLPQMKDYVGLAFGLLVAFGIIFELPIFIIILTAFKIVNFKKLMGFQKYMILIAFVIGAVLTPPDAVTQFLMAIPIIALYEIGLLLSWIFSRSSPSP